MGKAHQLWKYNPITGYWVHQRECGAGLEMEWLRVFYRSEPNAVFRCTRRKPTGKPNSTDERTRWLCLNR